ncbi:hypothetical protein SESBI_00947 [Sesbania bispinosa]|nr:hypothetical protein SESBI_00947 [Sesbania bispinosa]
MIKSQSILTTESISPKAKESTKPAPKMLEMTLIGWKFQRLPSFLKTKVRASSRANSSNSNDESIKSRKQVRQQEEEEARPLTVALKLPLHPPLKKESHPSAIPTIQHFLEEFSLRGLLHHHEMRLHAPLTIPQEEENTDKKIIKKPARAVQSHKGKTVNNSRREVIKLALVKPHGAVRKAVHQALKGRLQKSQDHAEKVEKPQSKVNFESWKEDA